MRLSGDELFSAGPGQDYVNEITQICVCLFVCLFVLSYKIKVTKLLMLTKIIASVSYKGRFRTWKKAFVTTENTVIGNCISKLLKLLGGEWVLLVIDPLFLYVHIKLYFLLLSLLEILKCTAGIIYVIFILSAKFDVGNDDHSNAIS